MSMHFVKLASDKLRQFGPCIVAAAAGIAVSLSRPA